MTPTSNALVFVVCIRQKGKNKELLLVRKSASERWGLPRFDGPADRLRIESVLAEFFASPDISDVRKLEESEWTIAENVFRDTSIVECRISASTRAKDANLVWFASRENVVSYNLTEDAQAAFALPLVQSRLA